MFCKNSLIFLIVHPPHTTIYFRMDGTYTEKVNYTKPKLDEYGNPVMNIKSMKIRSGYVFRKGRGGGKRGRPRT